MKQETPVAVIGAGVLTDGTPFYLVSSGSEPGRSHVVKQWPVRLECDCGDHQYRRRDCKHIRAVVAHKQRLELERATTETVVPVERRAVTRVSHGTPMRFGGRDQRPFSLMK